MHITLVFVLSLVLVVSGSRLDNGLGRRPQMGWNSWNAFSCNINETLITQMAQAMVRTGLLSHGYNYLNMDDCWALNRNATGYVQADNKTFPSGIKGVADYVHSIGLKFGIYSDAGKLTCGGRPGSLGFETQDATQYAAWTVDYLKYDNCDNQGLPDPPRYRAMRDALNKTGRPIFFSLCDWTATTAVWGPSTGNSWRTTTDIQNYFDSWTNNLDQNNAVAVHAAPGGWNDPDMLEVGNGLSHDENIAHFSLWTLIKAPLILGNDLRNITEDVLSILTNPEAIAVNQDSLGKQGVRIAHDLSTNPKLYSNVLYADDCKGIPAQKWVYNSTHQRLSTNYLPGLCVGRYVPAPWGCYQGPAPSGQLYLQECGKLCNGNTQWFNISQGLFIANSSNGQACIEISEMMGGGHEVQMAWNCTGKPNQQWHLLADGTIRNAHGRCLTIGGGQEIWAGPLSDGSQAVVLFNRATLPQKIAVTWANLGFSGRASVRDLWLRKDLGQFAEGYSAIVNARGAVFIKVKHENA